MRESKVKWQVMGKRPCCAKKKLKINGATKPWTCFSKLPLKIQLTVSRWYGVSTISFMMFLVLFKVGVFVTYGKSKMIMGIIFYFFLAY
jgi:hypothetical protein